MAYNNPYNPSSNNQPPIYSPPQYQPQSGMEPPPYYFQRSRVVAGLLGFFLGTLGVHSFYLGNTPKGLAQLLISLLTCGFGAIFVYIWSVVESVKILDGRINTDGNGVFLKD